MDIPPFNPGSYTDVSGLPESAQLWAFLNDEKSRTKMKAASDLGRPALEVLDNELLAEFGEQFREGYPYRDRFKQMAGAMTRQVMESEGYIWVRDNVPLSGGTFSRASKYRRHDAFEFHIWRLSTNVRFLGVTSEKSKEKLPPQPDGDWIYWKRIEGVGEGKLHLSIGIGIPDVPAALQALKEHGAYAAQTQRMMRAP